MLVILLTGLSHQRQLDSCNKCQNISKLFIIFRWLKKGLKGLRWPWLSKRLCCNNNDKRVMPKGFCFGVNAIQFCNRWHLIVMLVRIYECYLIFINYNLLRFRVDVCAYVMLFHSERALLPWGQWWEFWIVIGICWTNFCLQKLKRRILVTLGFNRTTLRATQPKLHTMFCALFLKIALSDMMSFGHLGAAIWHLWTIICEMPTCQRQLTL